ncbi:hypothetical protein ACQKWADRAFT_303673 [Trichoderma austrokoningii]
MQYEDLMKPDEDWRGLEDPLQRRKIQNRIAQRAYRRNMRQRAKEVEQLKKQLEIYEEFHLHTPTQSKETTYQQSTSPPMLSPDKPDVGGWHRPQQATLPIAAGERYHTSLPNNPQFNCMQGQICPPEMEQHMAGSPRSTRQQRPECWSPTSSRRATTDPPTPAQSLSMECGIKSDDMLLLGSTDLSVMMDEFSFDATKMADKRRQSTSLLHMAVSGNHIDTIKVLLQDDRIMLDEKDSDGFTPLQQAVLQGKSEIVKLLLEYTTT